ncbi:9066_t:CDS:2 [Paraglomus brasilianum]|uniref:9066_t:CDS:1 n=1 Tax=Paraglomus brasilianum TaxID=144538 RepID=A0A9N9BQD8_9GLOM|nr:9066_t:CDS:2 [Paraglomus brasilianum]
MLLSAASSRKEQRSSPPDYSAQDPLPRRRQHPIENIQFIMKKKECPKIEAIYE